jgi:capsular exopolysaccharide synthesis family protein
VITPALPSNVPTSPKKTQFIVVSLLVGLGAGAGLAYLLEKLNAGLTTAAQVEEMLNLPVIASIAKLRKRDLTVDQSPVPMSQYVAHRPMSYLSEAFRSLRGAVQMSDVDHPPKVLQITSTIPSEGKTTIALALAASWAQAGLKILLLEADLRHPSASHFLNVAANCPGVVEYLTGTAELADTIGYDSQLQLWFLPAGGKTQNPSDLLGSERMKRLVEILRGRFDLIIVDTPPAGLVIDPIIVSHLVDKIIFVVRWAATPREMVAQSIARLGDHKKLSGIAFNYVDEAQAAKYGGAHYYRHHYYESYSKK